MTPKELQTRFKEWAISAVLFTRNFPDFPEFKSVRNQIVRSAPSSAANYRAACRRKSGKDFTFCCPCSSSATRPVTSA
ncbi:MAG: four helix bundle protein [Saprospiraceae bacterium]|nr:four helix bundle protein [Saprospiraceae bacterium]